jgi:hypothetical protein
VVSGGIAASVGGEAPRSVGGEASRSADDNGELSVDDAIPDSSRATVVISAELLRSAELLEIALRWTGWV